MKRTTILSLSAALIALSVSAMAQVNGGNAQPEVPRDHQGEERSPSRRSARLQELDRELELTDDQKQRIEAIWDRAEQKAREIKADDDLGRRKRRIAAREAMKATHAEVRAVLTPEQQKRFDAMPRGGKRRNQNSDTTTE
jgi:Spy/CpxP family protein refolding chaperone